MAPLLAEKRHAGNLPLVRFAAAVGGLRIRSAEFRAILADGLHDPDRITVRACALALAETSDEPDRTAALIIAAAGKGPFSHRDAIEILQRMTPAAGTVVPYLIQQISSTDHWTCHDAIHALGMFGPAAAPALGAIKTHLDDKPTEIRLQAAKTIFQISGDAAPLDQELKAVFAGQNAQDRSYANKTIAELGPAGAPLLHFVLAELNGPGPLPKTGMIDVLKAIGNAEAAAALKEIAESTDWALRSRATTALKELQDSAGKEGT